jgi:hypothetical protein
MSVLIPVFMTLTCLRLILKTVREAWDLWDRYVARKGRAPVVCPEPVVRLDGEPVDGGDGEFQQMRLW